MSTGRPPAGSIPTLTEVVSWPAVAPPPPPAVPVLEPPVAPEVAAAPAPQVVPVAAPVAAPIPAAVPATVPAPAPTPTAVAPIDEEQLRQRVLADIQRQVDLMLEVRLREALAPAVARATDALVRDARKELTSTLRDVVSKSVAQALAERGGG